MATSNKNERAWTPQDVKALECAMINKLEIGITSIDQAQIPKPNKLPLEAKPTDFWGRIRVDHISKSVSNVDSKLFIPFQYIRIYTKKIFSHIGTDLGVPQEGSNFTKGRLRANMTKTRK